MEKMRILQVGSAFTNFEGKLLLTFRFTKGLQELGHNVDIITTDADCYFFDKERSQAYQNIRQKLLNSKGGTVEINGLTAHVVHSNTPHFGGYSFSAKKIAEAIIKNYDVVHVCSWYTHLGMVFSEIAHKYGIPFVISPWGSLQSEARLMKKNLKFFADMKFTKKLLHHAYFHSVGTSETEALIKLGVNSSKIYRIDSPVNLEDFKIKKKTNIFEKIHFDKNNKYLLYLSRIDKKKGLELLLHSFKKIHDANQNIFLIIAGSGENEYTKEIKKLVSDLHITDAVRFTGFVSIDEKLELFESAKIFVLTSHSDVHPIAVQEALTMGVPVIITKNSDYPEVEEYNAGILVDENEQSVFNAIMNLLSNENELLHMSNNAKELIKQRFLLKDQVKKHEDMYNDIIKKENRIA